MGMERVTGMKGAMGMNKITGMKRIIGMKRITGMGKGRAGFVLAVVMLAAALAGCGGRAYTDGVYGGESSPDDTGAWGVVTLTIAGGRVADCVYVARQKDGTVKDADYGKVNGEVSNQDLYNRAQIAVRAMGQYARSFRESGDLRKVAAVSGATVSFNQFTEAVEAALKKARR
jgi:major membrane immunogen (membrane-anchored lipoprotein)